MMRQRINELENEIKTFENTFSSIGKAWKKASRYVNYQMETARKECNIQFQSNQSKNTKKSRNKKKNGK